MAPEKLDTLIANIPDSGYKTLLVAEMDRLRANERIRQSVILQLEAERVAMKAEIERLRKLITCGCGDEFTEHDPGTCGNCVAGMRE